MATVNAFEAQLKEFERLAGSTIQHEMIAETSKIYTTVIRASVYGATNGGRLRGVGKNGARVGVRATPVGSAASLISAFGPLHLIERDTAGHDIPRTTSSRRTRTAAGRLSHKRESTGRTLSGRKVLLINGSYVMGPVRHPGTKGKHPFDLGVVAAAPAAAIAADTVFARSIASVFRG